MTVSAKPILAVDVCAHFHWFIRLLAVFICPDLTSGELLVYTIIVYAVNYYLEVIQN